MGLKIGYAKLGRSLPLTLDGCGMSGGDIEGIAVLMELALKRPQDTFYILGRNSGENPQAIGFPHNVVNPWTEWQPELLKWKKANGLQHSDLSIEEQLKYAAHYRETYGPTFKEMDHMVIWVGQHGSSNSPIPTSKDPTQLTKPHDWEVHYCSYLLHCLNLWRDVDPLKHEEIFLNSDPRNTLKLRDLRWPWRHSVLTQYNYAKSCKHERGPDQDIPPEWAERGVLHADEPTLWTSRVNYIYSRLEINAMSPHNPFGAMIEYNSTWEGRRHFGLFINEARPLKAGAEVTRGPILTRWVLPLQPAFIHGKWDMATQREIGVDITLAPWDQYFPLLTSVRSTFTTPSSGSAWATAKPWEAFAAGTVCFFHPNYDTQDNILHDADPVLANYLRITYPQTLVKRVNEMNTNHEKWEKMVRLQREHFERSINDLLYVKMIEERLDA